MIAVNFDVERARTKSLNFNTMTTVSINKSALMKETYKGFRRVNNVPFNVLLSHNWKLAKQSLHNYLLYKIESPYINVKTN